MVGGKVTETIILEDKVYINVEDDGQQCAIYVERSDKARSISEGETVWWQGAYAMWTPKRAKWAGDGGKGGIDYDIKLRRIGYSGAKRPEALLSNENTE